MTSLNQESRTPSQLISDLIVASFGDIEVDGHQGIARLDAAELKADTKDAKAQRFELITASRGGKHIELSVDAQTFAQTKEPNRRFLRLADDKLEARAGTWKGQPYLKDHRTWSTDALLGTILSSKAVPITGGMALEQKLHAVRPEAVIGILDGTFNKFSVSWWPLGAILCSVHNSDIMKLDGCNCWPGDRVKLEDGRERVVEFVFTDYKGKESSTVVIPAVQDTSVDGVRAALAAELGLDTSPRFIRTRGPVRETPPVKETTMLNRLAAAMGLAVLAEGNEDEALAAWKALGQRATLAESKLAAVETKLSQAQEAVKAVTASALKVQVDAILAAEGYGKGKLAYSRDAEGKKIPSAREGRLRKLAAGENGISELKAELAEMPVVARVAPRAQVEGVKEPELTELGDTDEDTNPYLADACAQLGVKVEDARKFAREHDEGRR